MTRTIGGTLDYAALARLHEPTDPNAIASEVRRLHGQGLTGRDIAAALRISHVQVNTILAPMVAPTPSEQSP